MVPRKFSGGMCVHRNSIPGSLRYSPIRWNQAVGKDGDFVRYTATQTRKTGPLVFLLKYEDAGDLLCKFAFKVGFGRIKPHLLTKQSDKYLRSVV